MSITWYVGSPTIGEFGRYVPGSKQPPGPQNDTEYRFGPAGAMERPNSSSQWPSFQKPASGWLAVATDDGREVCEG